MEKISENVAVFFNKDCMKYGVKVKLYNGEWTQVITKGIYTKYKGVAKRWAQYYAKMAWN